MGADSGSDATVSGWGLFSGFGSIDPSSAVCSELGMSDCLVGESIELVGVLEVLEEISENNCDRLLSGSLRPNVGNSN